MKQVCLYHKRCVYERIEHTYKYVNIYMQLLNYKYKITPILYYLTIIVVQCRRTVRAFIIPSDSQGYIYVPLFGFVIRNFP